MFSGALACVGAGAGWWGWGAGGLEVLQQRLQLPQAGVHVLLQPLLHGVLGEDAVQGGRQLLREGAPPAQETESPAAVRVPCIGAACASSLPVRATRCRIVGNQ